MDMTQDQLAQEFARQVRLCSGLGQSMMLRIVEAEFGGGSSSVDDLRAQLQDAKLRDFEAHERRMREEDRSSWRERHLGRRKRGRS
tara:strand:+ start:214 stop:471 length:258 start_codon:yes stop_codon:yes gene_type:complete